jgi:Secretion system C-terminal sorting domain
MNGRTVMTNEVDKNVDLFEKTLNVSGLASGMYMIQVNIANRRTLVTKFIKK